MEPPAENAENLIPTRSSLLSRLENWQDDRSWQDFFDTYWRLIYSVARRAGLTDTEAQEVVQETVISVAKNIHTFKRDRRLGTFKGWLCHITRWRISDQFRKRTHLPIETNSLADIPEDGSLGVDPVAEAIWETEWKDKLLLAAMERVRTRIKPVHFQIFDLCVLRGWPIKKVADTLDVSLPQIYLAKHRVAALIKKEISLLEKGSNLKI